MSEEIEIRSTLSDSEKQRERLKLAVRFAELVRSSHRKNSLGVGLSEFPEIPAEISEAAFSEFVASCEKIFSYYERFPMGDVFWQSEEWKQHSDFFYLIRKILAAEYKNRNRTPVLNDENKKQLKQIGELYYRSNMIAIASGHDTHVTRQTIVSDLTSLQVKMKAVGRILDEIELRRMQYYQKIVELWKPSPLTTFVRNQMDDVLRKQRVNASEKGNHEQLANIGPEALIDLFAQSFFSQKIEGGREIVRKYLNQEGEFSAPSDLTLQIAQKDLELMRKNFAANLANDSFDEYYKVNHLKHSISVLYNLLAKKRREVYSQHFLDFDNWLGRWIAARELITMGEGGK